jgi:LPXTG-motif cell wall-anchored protein
VRLATTTATGRRLLSGSAVAVVAACAALTTGVGIAAADAGWSRSPGSGIAGGTVDVASSPSTLCQWIQPTSPDDPPPSSGNPTTSATPDPASAATATPSGDTVYDGTEVRARLVQDRVEVPLTSFAVTPGGAWSGTITLPDTDTLPPGSYDLIVKCVIDRPELDGVRTYDFDPLPFTVNEAPPPTTVVLPPVELVPPITAVNPVQVEGVQVTRPASTPAAQPAAAAAGPTLPNTGDGTLETALAGFAALAVGAAALWWGARHGRRRPEADLVDG